MHLHIHTIPACPMPTVLQHLTRTRHLIRGLMHTNAPHWRIFIQIDQSQFQVELGASTTHAMTSCQSNLACSNDHSKLTNRFFSFHSLLPVVNSLYTTSYVYTHGKWQNAPVARSVQLAEMQQCRFSWPDPTGNRRRSTLPRFPSLPVRSQSVYHTKLLIASLHYERL